MNHPSTLNGCLYIVSAPSGAGKTSLVSAVVTSDPDLLVSISHTTRPIRPGEVQGSDYHFVSRESYQQMLAHDDFLEHATVFGNLYGTSRSWVSDAIGRGKDVVLEIDWQGARQVRERFPEAVSVYILPPSLSSLQARLKARGQDGDEVISERMREAVDQMMHFDEADYLIVNDDFERALADLRSILQSNRLRREPQSARYRELIAALLSG